MKSSKNARPYSNTPHAYVNNTLRYTTCWGPNMRDVHTYVAQNFMNQPTHKADYQMMRYPVFTTWSYFFRNIDQAIVLDYAKQIREHNYTISQLEIDDKWEEFYGDIEFDRKKFPNISELTEQLHAMNMRVTLWTHPFCNLDSKNFVIGVKNGYWVKDRTGLLPGLTTWWDGAPGL